MKRLMFCVLFFLITFTPLYAIEYAAVTETGDAVSGYVEPPDISLDDLVREMERLPVTKLGDGKEPTEKRKGRSITISEPVNQMPSQAKLYERIKAVQIFVLPASMSETQAMFARWRQSGINTIILRVFQNDGDRFHGGREYSMQEGVYFMSRKLPMIRDLLADVSTLAHKEGLKIYAWMTTRYANYTLNKLERMIAYSPAKKKFVESKGFNVLSKDVQDFICDVYADLAQYPIDGILLQDDLVLRQYEGFNESTIKAFKAETGIDAEPSKLFTTGATGKVGYTKEFWAWQRWKTDRVAQFVKRLRDTASEKNPSIKLAVNLMYEAVAHPKGALAWLAQDIEAIKPYADYFSLMAYHRQIMDELKIDFPGATDYLANMVKKCLELSPDEPQRFLFKLQAKDWSTSQQVGGQEFRSIVSSAEGIERLSLAIAPYPPELPDDVMKLLFNDRKSASISRRSK